MFLEAGYRGLNEIWRYGLGIFIVLMGYFLGQIPLFIVQYSKIQSNPEIGGDALREFEKTMDFTLLDMNKNVGFFLLVLMFFFAFAALIIVISKLHHKKVKDTIAPDRPIDVRRIIFGFGFWFVLSVCIEFIFYLIHPEQYRLTINWINFIPLFFIAVFMLPVQTSFEEIFFRGYIMQGVSVYASNKWVPILVSSIAFGMMHSMNPEIEKFGMVTMQTYYILAGLFLAVITVMDDGLELALGVHAATNIFGALLISYDGSVLQTDSLAKTSDVNPYLMIVGLCISIIIFLWVASKKYNWKSFDFLTSKLNPQGEPQV